MLKVSQMHSYQRQTAKHIIDRRYAGVFLDMGLGKTVSTLTAINYLYNSIDVHKVLIVAPKRVAAKTWSDEINSWEHLKGLSISVIEGTAKQRIAALNKDAVVYTISRDLVVWLIEHLKGYNPFDMWVIDELSSFKSPSSKRFKALKNIRPQIRRLVGLTGTPAPNGLLDLWAQVYLLDRGERLERYITHYRTKYFTTPADFKYVLKEGAKEAIEGKLKDLCISMQAKDYLQLPDNNIIDIKYDLDPAQLAAYKEFAKELVLNLPEDELHVDNAAALMNKLQQYAHGSLYDENKNVIHVHNERLETLERLIDELQGKPALIAYSFKFDRDAIVKRFGSRVRELKTPKDIDDWNAGKIELLLTHPASAGHGLNLQKGGNVCIWYGLTWNLELYLQFNARLHRQGQKNKVFTYRLVCNNTVDTRLLKAIEKKNINQLALLEALKNDL